MGPGVGGRLFTVPGGFGRGRRLEAGFGDGCPGAGDGVLAREGLVEEQPGQEEEEYGQGDEQEQASSGGPLAGLPQLPAASPALAAGVPRLLGRIRSG
ncbi:MAG: hypothetical protein M3518_06085 [Actinomycetota bacterium]|nr:hypothetical protein [Actinomycetota bacterium]